LRHAHKPHTALVNNSRGDAFMLVPRSRLRQSLRQMKGIAGRLYQMHAGDSMVAIDLKPIAPILGRAALTHGQAELHPTEGKVVYFPGAKQQLGSIRITVRTFARPVLLELFDLAMALKS